VSALRTTSINRAGSIGFGRKIVRLIAQRAEYGLGSVEASHDDDLCAPSFLRTASQHVEPSEPRNQHIEEHDVDIMLADHLQCLQTVLLGPRAESGERDQLTQSLARRVIVIYDQNIAFRHGLRC
jgi:hypothetical protein